MVYFRVCQEKKGYGLDAVMETEQSILSRLANLKLHIQNFPPCLLGHCFQHKKKKKKKEKKKKRKKKKRKKKEKKEKEKKLVLYQCKITVEKESKTSPSFKTEIKGKRVVVIYVTYTW